MLCYLEFLPDSFRHNAKMTTLNKACHFDDERGEICSNKAVISTTKEEKSATIKDVISNRKNEE